MTTDPTFAPAERSAWAARVAADLGVDDADTELTRTTPSGLDARVLYTAEDATSRPLPEALRPKKGWRATESIEVAGDDFAMRAASASREGIACVRALGDPASVDGTVQARLLEAFTKQQGGRRPWLVLRPTADGPSAFVGHVDPQHLLVFGGYDPVRAVLADGAGPFDAAQAAHEEHTSVERFASVGTNTPALEVDTAYLREAGAHAVDAIGIGLASATERMRGALAQGTAPRRWFDSCAWRVGVGRDLFEEIAALRALRLCVAKLSVASAGGDAGPSCPVVHAMGLARELAPFDRPSNALRTSSQAFAAAVGGATTLEIAPFEQGSERGRRLARTTHAVLAHESHLGRVDDPAGGSWYVESLTDAVARAAWARFTAIEAAGGFSAWVGSGALAALLAERRAAIAAAVAAGTHTIIGVNAFAPTDDDEPAPAARSEAQRAGARPDPGGTGDWPLVEPCIDATLVAPEVQA